jgi:hypothetical protein
MAPVHPGSYEPVPVFWAHGPGSVLVDLTERDQTLD